MATNSRNWRKGQRGIRLAAKTLRPLQRFNCCMSVGHGFKSHPAGVNPIGSSVTVYGFSNEGMAVELPGGGVGTLGRLDVEPVNWPQDMMDRFNALPEVSIKMPGEVT